MRVRESDTTGSMETVGGMIADMKREVFILESVLVEFIRKEFQRVDSQMVVVDGKAAEFAEQCRMDFGEEIRRGVEKSCYGSGKMFKAACEEILAFFNETLGARVLVGRTQNASMATEIGNKYRQRSEQASDTDSLHRFSKAKVIATEPHNFKEILGLRSNLFHSNLKQKTKQAIDSNLETLNTNQIIFDQFKATGSLKKNNSQTSTLRDLSRSVMQVKENLLKPQNKTNPRIRPSSAQKEKTVPTMTSGKVWQEYLTQTQKPLPGSNPLHVFQSSTGNRDPFQFATPIKKYFVSGPQVPSPWAEPQSKVNSSTSSANTSRYLTRGAGGLGVQFGQPGGQGFKERVFEMRQDFSKYMSKRKTHNII